MRHFALQKNNKNDRKTTIFVVFLPLILENLNFTAAGRLFLTSDKYKAVSQNWDTAFT